MKKLPHIFLLTSLLLLHCTTGRMTVSGKIPTRSTEVFSESDLAELYANSFQGCYEYMFDTRKAVFNVGGTDFGPFTAGMKGMILYSGFEDAVTAHLQKEGNDAPPAYTEFYDLTKFKDLAGGIPVFLNEQGEFQAWGINNESGQDFHHYNPEIVKWGYTHLIPDPDSDISGYTFSILYAGIFKRFFRLMTLTYLDLQAGKFQSETASYKQQMADPGFEALDYLERRFEEKLKDYRPDPDDFTAMSPGMAYGFWIRRGIDGTAGEFWKGLSRVMTTYDREWLSGKVKIK